MTETLEPAYHHDYSVIACFYLISDGGGVLRVIIRPALTSPCWEVAAIPVAHQHLDSTSRQIREIDIIHFTLAVYTRSVPRFFRNAEIHTSLMTEIKLVQAGHWTPVIGYSGQKNNS